MSLFLLALLIFASTAVLAVPTLNMQKAYAANTNDAGIGYRSGTGAGVTAPKYREWDGSANAWTSEVELTDTGSAVRSPWIEFSPISSKRVMMVLAADGQLDAYVCVASCTTASNWNVTLSVVDLWSATPSGADRPFDLEFEATSGNLILVYDKVSTTSGEELFYRVMSKGSVTFGAEVPINTPTSNSGSDTVYPYLRLDSRKTSGSDEIAMILQDDSNLDVHAMIWNGSAWGDSTTITSTYAASSTRTEVIGIAYETNSGDAIAIAGNTTNVLYREHTAGGAWGSASSAGTWAVGNIAWMTAKGNPLSTKNEVFVSAQGSDSDMDTMYWNGTGWTDHTEHDAAVDIATLRIMDFAWEENSSNGILVWGTAAGQIDFKRFTAPSTFSSQLSIADTSTHRYFQLVTNPATADDLSVLGLTVDQTSDISGLKWNGGSANLTTSGDGDITTDTNGAIEMMSVAFQRSTASELVTLSIVLNMASGSATPEDAGVAYTVSGTGCTGTLTHDGDFALQTFLCGPNTTITFGTPTDAATSRFRFSDGSTSKTFTSCFAGACATQTYNNNMRQFLVTSLTFKATDGSTLNTQPSAFTLTDAGNNAFTSISNSWLAQGTSTLTGITWNGLDVTPTANTMSISATGAKTLDVDIGITSDSRFQMATDDATVIDNINYDNSIATLTFNATSSGSKDTVIEYEDNTFDSARTISVDASPISSGFSDNHAGLITITGTSFSERMFTLLMTQKSSGGGSGSGNNTNCAPGFHLENGVCIPDDATGTVLDLQVVMPHFQNISPGTSYTGFINVTGTGVTKFSVTKIEFLNKAHWFTLPSQPPIIRQAYPTETGPLTLSIPVILLIPQNEQLENATQISVRIEANSGGSIASSTLPMTVAPFSFIGSNEMYALGAIGALVLIGLAAKGGGKGRRRYRR